MCVYGYCCSWGERWWRMRAVDWANWRPYLDFGGLGSGGGDDRKLGRGGTIWS